MTHHEQPPVIADAAEPTRIVENEIAGPAKHPEQQTPSTREIHAAAKRDIP